MFLTKIKTVLVLLAVAAVMGADPDPKQPSRKADQEEARRLALLEQARVTLDRITREYQDQEKVLMSKRIETRQHLVILQEKLRQLERDPWSVREIDPEETRLQTESAQIEARIQQLKATLARPNDQKQLLDQLEQQRQQIRKSLAKSADLRAEMREVRMKERIQLRLEMVQQEEALEDLERQRSWLREEADRRREAAADRVWQLEGNGPLPDSQDRSLRAVQRKLDALHAELAELRREVRRLRESRPNP